MRTVKDTGRPNIDTIPGRTRANFPSIRDDIFWNFYERASPFSLVHITGFYNVFQSMKYIDDNKLDGDIVECGCFLGGVGIFLALMREHLKMKKKILLFDSFEGFPPGEEDTVRGKVTKSVKFSNILQHVKENIASVTRSLQDIEFIEGFVENTLPYPTLQKICLLRLDTDFYNSTHAELKHLYPLLVKGGALIVDDYGLFDGSRRATDEWFRSVDNSPLLNRIDEGVWAGVKP